ncbi:MAG: hypothetical protein RIS80_731 [Actinomycetota bacterium]
MVCLGNICRSPMAELMLRDAADAAGLSGVHVESAGVSAEVGEPATPHTVTVLEEHGIDGSRHVARQLTELMLANADLVLVATESVRRRVLTYENADEQKVRLMLGDVDLDDPWGMSLETYRSTARQLAPAIDELVAGMRGSS